MKEKARRTTNCRTATARLNSKPSGGVRRQLKRYVQQIEESNKERWTGKGVPHCSAIL